MSKNQISKKTFEEQSKQLKELKARRKTLSKAIGEARDHGDLKENSAYHEAKNDQGMNEMKIRELEEKLRDVEIVADVKTRKDKVMRGVIVTLKDLKYKDTIEYTIVSDFEADIMENKISETSLLGEALMYHKVNETVQYEAPGGTMKYKILKIS
jgi:transcription elongation factor GreA